MARGGSGGGNSGFLGALGSFFGGPVGGFALNALGGILGQSANERDFRRLRGDIMGMARPNPTSFFGPGAFVNANTGTVALDPFQQSIQNALGGQVPALFGGGDLFNSDLFQSGLGLADLGPAVGGLNAQLSRSASPLFDPSAFSQLGTNIQSLGNLFAASTAAGPQDFFGGAGGQLLGSGLLNQARAGDQSDIFNQSLATFRQAAEPATNRLINRLQDRLFAQGRLGSTGGAQETEHLANALFQQDLGFQQAARRDALDQQQFLAGLGGQQISAGAGFLGRNLDQFNLSADLANRFATTGLSREGQGFQQALGALTADQTAGINRLDALSRVFSLGAGLQNQGFTQGLQGGGFLLDQAGFGRDTLVNLLNADANRIGAQSVHSQALANALRGGTGRGGFLSSLIGGLGGLFGG